MLKSILNVLIGAIGVAVFTYVLILFIALGA